VRSWGRVSGLAIASLRAVGGLFVSEAGVETVWRLPLTST
jgi:hypothetical protein